MSEVEVKESAPAESVASSPESTTPVADAAITEIAEKVVEKPIEDLSAKELAELRVKIAEYESKLKEVESKYSESEKEASLYRSKAPLLKNIEGLSEEAVAALKNKDVWALLDSAGIEEEHLYNELAKGRPQLTVEEKIRKEIEKIQRAEASKVEREQKAIAEKRKVETMQTLSDWLDLTDVTKVDPALHDAHEILRAAREEKDLAVEETLISLVEQSNITYAEAVKTLAEVIEKKVMKYTSIKALDSKIASRYKKEDTPAPAAPVDSKAKEVLKTIGDKVEEASKHVDTDSIIDRSSMDLSDVLKSIKEKEKRKASNLRRL